MQKIVDVINEIRRIIVFVNVEININCNISMNIDFYFWSSWITIIQNFRSKTDLHRTNRDLFEKKVLDDEERKKELCKCLIEIRNKAKFEDLIQTNTHWFLQILQRFEKFQRYYIQNLNELKTKADLNADIEFKDCDVIQLHDNLNFFKCSFYSHFTSWDDVRENAFVFKEIVFCFECVSKVKERRRKRKRTNIYVKHLRFNIVFNHDIDDFLSEIKASVIDKDANLTFDVLLIVNTSLIINDSRYKFKNKLISTIRRNDEKIIYVNNNSFSRTFFKLVIDYIFEINCDY